MSQENESEPQVAVDPPQNNETNPVNEESKPAETHTEH